MTGGKSCWTGFARLDFGKREPRSSMRKRRVMVIALEQLRRLIFPRSRSWAKSHQSLTSRGKRSVVIPRRLLRQLVLSGLSFFIITIYSPYAKATTCSCKQHQASAEASGTCSRTEDEKKCTLAFTTTTPAEYADFVKRLKDIKLTADPRETLRIVSGGPPEKWPSNFVMDLLPVLFAISQRTHFTDPNDALNTINEIRNFEFEKRKTEIEDAIRNPKYRQSSTKISLNRYNAVISYGCIELQLDKFYTMVKTQWSGAMKFCDDFK